MPSTHAKLMDELKALHDKKAADYANEANRFANFERSAEISSWFSDPIDKVFTTLIGVKLARIAELTQPGRKVNNESLDDSFVDLTNYCAIWTSYRRDRMASPSMEPCGFPADSGPLFCDHANEVRSTCTCGDTCYCRGRSCPAVKYGKQVNPGSISLPHKFYEKGDGTCMVCGLKSEDWVERKHRGCAHPGDHL